MSYLLRRVAVGVFQVFVLSILMFVLFRVAPGDYYTAALEERSAGSVEDMRQASGLQRSWLVQYGDWLGSCARGEFGVSVAYRLPVSALVGPRVATTLRVAVPGLVLAWLLGLSGAFLFARRRVIVDSGVSAAAMVPDVILIGVVLWISVWLGVSITGAWLPMLGLTLSLIPVVFLHASSELRKAFELEFVRIAESRGVRGLRLWTRYVLPAAANPLVSLAGLSLAAAIGSSFVVEALTGWPGVGPMFLEAVQARDYPVVQTVLTGLSSVLVVSNLVADLVLYRLDPRIRSAA